MCLTSCPRSFTQKKTFLEQHQQSKLQWLGNCFLNMGEWHHISPTFPSWNRGKWAFHSNPHKHYQTHWSGAMVFQSYFQLSALQSCTLLAARSTTLGSKPPAAPGQWNPIWCHHGYILVLHSLKLTAKAPENRPFAPKRKRESIPIIHFQVQTVCFRVPGNFLDVLNNFQHPETAQPQPSAEQIPKPSGSQLNSPKSLPGEIFTPTK